MSHSQEPSYYEIALTNRQVLGFFVVLLLCVVGAFFSGIWLGKRQGADLPVVAQAAAVSEEATDESEPLQELNFFTDSPEEAAEPAPKPAEPQRQPPPPRRQPEPQLSASSSSTTTLREDVEATEPPARPAVEPPRREEPAVEQPREPAGLTPQEPVSSETYTPPPVAGGYVIQVFASPDGQQARRLRERIAAAGYDVFILEEVVDGRTVHRVRVGPYAERAEAARVEPRLKTEFKVETWVTRHQ